MVQEAGLSKKGDQGNIRAAHCDLPPGGGDKGSLSFFTDTFFWWFGTSVKVQKVSNFFGENLEYFNH